MSTAADGFWLPLERVHVASTATASRGSRARLSRAGLLLASLLLVFVGGCSEFPRARGGATGVRVGARHPALGEPLSAPGRAADAPALQLLDSHESGLFNLGAAEIVDFHPASRQVFVVNSRAARVTVLRLGQRGFERGERALEPRRDVADFRAGQVTSLAVSGDLVAVSVCAESNDRRGRVAFYAAGPLDYLGAVSVGYVPDMLTFAPDGKTLLVANEGEQVRNADERIVSDPAGSVSIVDLSRGVESASVVEATFEAFDGRIEEYRNAGVRVPRLGGRFFESGEGQVKLSQDLEPEYIAVAPDGKTAWVSLQENDAVAVLDLESQAFSELLPLGVKDFSVGLPARVRVPLPEPALAPARPHAASRPALRDDIVLVASRSGEPVAPAVGLWFDAPESQPDHQVFYVLRGGAIERLVLGEGRVHGGSVAILPEAPSASGFRGLVRDPVDQSFWLGGAEDGVLYHVSAEGRFLHALPLAQVRHGDAEGRSSIAALALDGSRRRLFVLHQPARARQLEAATRLVRVLVIDVDPQSRRFGAGLGEYLYLGDAALAAAGAPGVTAAAFADDRLLVLEQGPAAPGRRSGGALRVFRADLAGAKDVLALDTPGSPPLEACSADELYENYGVSLVHKQRVHALPAADAPRRVSGLAQLGDASLVMLGQGASLGAGARPAEGEGDTPVLDVVSYDDNNRFDASDRDGKAALARWPVLGGYMPDGIDTLRVAGRDYLVTANEGDTRSYDAKRLADVELDPRRFPDATALQSRATLGRLKVSAFDGDLDADGDLDEIHAFGARSVSVWDAAGNLVADTGSLFEEVTALALADAFNSNNDQNGTFDSRSDDKGPEPEGLEVAEIDGRVYAFVGLERVGGIVVLELTDPRGAVFVEYVNPRDFSGSAARGQARDLGPEGLRFIPARESPTGRGLLLVGNEVSGTTSVYDVNL